MNSQVQGLSIQCDIHYVRLYNLMILYVFLTRIASFRKRKIQTIQRNRDGECVRVFVCILVYAMLNLCFREHVLE